MEPILVRYRDRDLSAAEFALMRATLAAHCARGRSFIAQVHCEHRDWHQPNRAYKGFAGRDLTLHLDEGGHVVLPPPQRDKNSHLAERCGFIEVHRSVLPSIEVDGLWSRLCYDRSASTTFSVLVWFGVVLALPLIEILPADISLQIFRREVFSDG
ncbi:MAG: hypothetical protein MN733_11645 [Nitrososphaera sp.]|nr:hypothetical protein [Nitrososphaera sp.]